MALPPRLTANLIASTLPRMPGPVDSCIRAFDALRKVSVAMPMTISEAAKSQNVGASAASRRPAANTKALRGSNAKLADRRSIDSNAPLTPPTARIGGHAIAPANHGAPGRAQQEQGARKSQV